MFVIVRHGNTFAAGQPSRRIGARTDLPLTEQGLEQGRALGVHFAALEWRFRRVWVSPLQRARETARAILDQLPAGQTEIEFCDWLREIDHGPDEGRTEDEVIARIGADALAAWDVDARPPLGWIVDAEARKAAWAALFASDAGSAIHESILLVTSNGAARFALLADPALQVACAGLASLKLPTGSYGVIRRSAQGSLEMPIWGRRP